MRAKGYVGFVADYTMLCPIGVFGDTIYGNKTIFPLMAYKESFFPSSSGTIFAMSSTEMVPNSNSKTALECVSQNPQRIGIMGGTFDPIHNGHLVAGSEVADQFELDLVVFVPTGQPWQKSHRRVSPAEHRYLMTVIATASNPRFQVSRVDINRGGQTYTVDTLHDLRKVYPDAELFFITGSDALAQIVTWHNWEEMFELAHFVGVTRPGYELSHDLPLQQSSKVSLIEIPAMAISSTDCRLRSAAGRPVWYLVPDGVVQYIAKHCLYQDWPTNGMSASLGSGDQ